MKLTLWHRFLKHGLPDDVAPAGRSGTTIVHEERGSGTGAVLFQSYAVSEFVPDATADAGAPALAEFPAAEVAGTVPRPSAAPRTPNPVADEWRKNSPDVFQTVARRFCARAPKAAQELREFCLSGQNDRLARLATSLKPTLSLFDMSAAEAAERVEKVAVAGRHANLAHDVLALEHEVWRVADAWEKGDRHQAVDAHP
jgi:hypothetical protein